MEEEGDERGAGGRHGQGGGQSEGEQTAAEGAGGQQGGGGGVHGEQVRTTVEKRHYGKSFKLRSNSRMSDPDHFSLTSIKDITQS